MKEPRWEWEKVPEKTGIGQENPTPTGPGVLEQREVLMASLADVSDDEISRAQFHKAKLADYSDLEFLVGTIRGHEFHLSPPAFSGMSSFVDNLPLTKEEAKTWWARCEKAHDQAYS